MEMLIPKPDDIGLHGTLARQEKKRAKNSKKDQGSPSGLEANLDVDFDKLIETKKKLEQLPVLSPAEVDAILQALERIGKTEEAMQTVTEKIRTETRHFADYEELGLIAALRTGRPVTEVDGIPIQWGERKKRYMGGEEGLYSVEQRRAIIAHDHPKAKEMLYYLLLGGNFGQAIGTAAHEITHSTQFPTEKNVLEEEPKATPEIKKMHRNLHEVHAYRTQELHKKTSKTYLTRERIFNKRGTIKNYSGDKLSMPQLIHAITAIDQLMALDYSPKQIGRLIMQAGAWDKKKKQYADLQTFIDAKATDLGLDEFDLENLVQAHHLEREIERLRAVQIAQKTIRELKNHYQAMGLFGEAEEKQKAA